MSIEIVRTDNVFRYVTGRSVVCIEHLSDTCGVTSPGVVDTDNPNARVVFVREGEFVQAVINDRFPDGIGVPATDAEAIRGAFERIR